MSPKLLFEKLVNFRILIIVFDLTAAFLFVDIGYPFHTIPVPITCPTAEREVTGWCRPRVEVLVEPGTGGHHKAVLLPIQAPPFLVLRTPHEGIPFTFQD
jgi:hypothetical protein